MTDRELLELAAKAAGIGVLRSRLDDPACRDMLVSDSARNPCQKAGPWNPLTDDGDALRLAVKLRINIEYGRDLIICRVPASYKAREQSLFCENYGEMAATRRAIVRAAAEIGKRPNTDSASP